MSVFPIYLFMTVVLFMFWAELNAVMYMFRPFPADNNIMFSISGLYCVYAPFKNTIFSYSLCENWYSGPVVVKQYGSSTENT